MIIAHEDTSCKVLNDKTTRRVLCPGPELMLVEFCFAKGGIGEPHKHEEHEQVGYVARGSFEITVGDQTRIAKAGDCYYAPKNTMHGVVALEDDSVIIDTFYPIRKDFL